MRNDGAPLGGLADSVGSASAPGLLTTLGLVGYRRSSLGDHFVHGIDGGHQRAGGLDETGNFAHVLVKSDKHGNGSGAMLRKEAVGQLQLVVAVEHAEVDVVGSVSQAEDGWRGGHSVAAPVGREDGQVDGLIHRIEVIEDVVGNLDAGMDLEKRVLVDLNDVDVLVGGHTLIEFIGSQ